MFKGVKLTPADNERSLLLQHSRRSTGPAFTEALQPSLARAQVTFQDLPRRLLETAAAFHHAGAKRGDVVAM